MKRNARRSWALGLVAAGWLVGGILVPAQATDQNLDGRLTTSDLVMPSDGTFYKMHEFEAIEGQEIIVDLMSSDFDAFMIVHSPSGQIHHDDDGGDGLNSRLSISVDQSGTWKVFANTVGRGETGAYQLRIRTVDASQFETQTFTGSLTDASAKMPTNNAPFAEHSVTLQAGQDAVFNLTSAAFDAMIHVHSPSGQVFSDDDGGEGTNSRLSVTADQAGAWRVVATSYGPQERGDYTLTVRTRRTGISK